ncbi:uncharacterized protein LOC130825568 [Amaranthus tricolor]|uniref:uncharacterized protein LOC130825568 n=1 Tax=Amaranthus tricolor TaxID=29722 RepID=UPI0025837F7D|nr:uncharacterized protein LOC130825568 [Amaranthus tricolor]
MEGLIPMVFRAIKKNKIRRQYRCLSMGNSQTYNLVDFYDDHDHNQNHRFYSTEMQPRGGSKESRNGHRRFASTGEFGINGGYNFNYDHDHHDGGFGRFNSPPNNKQIIKRYGSHRLFSCITGAT